VHPPPPPAWANFTLMIECTPESSRLLLCVLCASECFFTQRRSMTYVHVPYMTSDREAFKATFCCCGKAEAERGRLPTWATQTSTTTLISTNSEVPLPSSCFFIRDTAQNIFLLFYADLTKKLNRQIRGMFCLVMKSAA
jgi:hypothetical protein